MKFTTSCEHATSKVSSGNGKSSARARITSTPGSRDRHASTKGCDGSAADTAAGPSRRTSSLVSAPGPQPTSKARIGGSTPAKSMSFVASRAA
jgi:hypothetical protein